MELLPLQQLHHLALPEGRFRWHSALHSLIPGSFVSVFLIGFGYHYLKIIPNAWSTMFYRFYSRKRKKAAIKKMIYSQAFRNEQFSPAVALFGAAGLVRTTAGISVTPDLIHKSKL